MKLFGWLFRRSNRKAAKKMIPITELKPDAVPPGCNILAQSEVPASLLIGDLVFEKKYEEAIKFGLDLLKESPDDAGAHINLMVAYFKARGLNDSYFDRSTYHAKMAILNGHHTGYAEQRLAINLDKQKFYHQSLQLYRLILDTEGFHFSASGCGNGIDWEKRRASVLAKIDKANDKETDILFTEGQISKIIKDIADEDEWEKIRSENWERINKELDKAMFVKKDQDETERLLKELRKWSR